MLTTYKFRLKDTCNSELIRQSCIVNQIWNFCEETQRHALKWNKKWPSAYELQKLTSGVSKELDIHSHTIQLVCHQYYNSRKINKKSSLNWRVSNKKSPKYSLGWI